MAERSRSSSSSACAALLPLVQCPRCDLKVIGAVCNNDKNKEKVYYMCPNYNRKHGVCRFFMWEEAYRKFIEDCDVDVAAPSTEARNGNKSTTVEENRELCAVLNKLTSVLDKLNMLVTAVVVLLFLQLASKFIQ